MIAWVLGEEQPLATEGKSQIFDKIFKNKSVHFWQQSWQQWGKVPVGKGVHKKTSNKTLGHTARVYVTVSKQINYCILWRTQTGESRWTHRRSPKNLSQSSLTSQQRSLHSHQCAWDQNWASCTQMQKQNSWQTHKPEMAPESHGVTSPTMSQDAGVPHPLPREIKQTFTGLVHKCSLRLSWTNPKQKHSKWLSACEQISKSRQMSSLLLVKCYCVCPQQEPRGDATDSGIQTLK